MSDKDFKDLKEVGEYITTLQDNFRLAIQKIEELSKDREIIKKVANKEIKRLMAEIKKGNDFIRTLLDLKYREN